MTQFHELLDEQQKQDIICTAFEGGSNYWIISEPVKITKIPAGAEDKYASEICCLKGGEIELIEDEDKKTHTLNLAKINKGINLCAKNYKHIFTRIISEDYDAGDADVILQLAIFEELIYG